MTFSSFRSSFCNGADDLRLRQTRDDDLFAVGKHECHSAVSPAASTVSVGLPMTSRDRNVPVWMNCTIARRRRQPVELQLAGNELCRAVFVFRAAAASVELRSRQIAQVTLHATGAQSRSRRIIADDGPMGVYRFTRRRLLRLLRSGGLREPQSAGKSARSISSAAAGSSFLRLKKYSRLNLDADPSCPYRQQAGDGYHDPQQHALDQRTRSNFAQRRWRQGCADQKQREDQHQFSQIA